MPALLIRNVPKDLHEALCRRAAENHRSVTKETLALLEDALRMEPKRLTIAQLNRRRVHGAKPLTDALLHRAKHTGRP